MNTTLSVEAVREALASGNRIAVESFVRSEHAADLASLLDELEPREAWQVLDMLGIARQAEVIGYMDPDDQVALATYAPRDRLARIVGEMDADDRVDLFNELPPAMQEALLPALAQAEREEIRRLAAYPEGTAGSIMTSEYALLPGTVTAREALERLRKEAPDKETIYNAYVVDDKRRLVGAVSLRDLILASPERRVSDLMQRNVIYGRVADDREEIAEKIARYDLLALPIINGEDKLVGIVTQDDAMDVREEEFTEDFHRHGSVVHIPENMREAALTLLYRKRIPWLVILVFGNIFSGAGIAFFEDTIEANVALVFFLPLLIDSGGNAGSQAATLMVRALATGDVALNDWWSMLGREVGVAGLLGATMAAAVLPLGVWRGGSEIAVVVTLTMMLVVVVGSVIGMLLPFVLSRFNYDPATASAPLITSMADVSGVIIYFSIATLWLSA